MALDRKQFEDAARFFYKDLCKKVPDIRQKGWRAVAAECPMPKISWCLTGQTLGQAQGSKEIRLHPGYAAAMGEDYYQVVGHEMAHIIVSYMTPPVSYWQSKVQWSSHGTEWKKAMRLIGLPPDRLAKNIPDDVVAAAVKPRKSPCTATISCNCNGGCKTYKVTPKRAAKLIGPFASCRRCGHRFRMIGSLS